MHTWNGSPRLGQCSGMSPDELASLVEVRVSVRLPPS